MVDEIGAGEQRDADMNRILNTLDGVQTKNNNLTVIFTTNHEQRINPALRRPGRIDLVINFANPDKVSVSKIFSMYAKDLVKNIAADKIDNIDWDALAERTPDASGAVIAEIAKRACKLCIKKGAVKEEYFKAAIDSMKHHMKLMAEPVETTKTGDMVIMVKNGVISSAPVEEMKDLFTN